MKKMMLICGMISGMAVAYVMFDKSVRKKIMNKVKCALDNVDKMM